MHTMWKGSISFGLVNIPIRMFAATESKDVKFRYLHKECKTPIQYTRTCPTCNRTVEWNDMVRGFEYEPDKFVLLDEEELKASAKKRAQTIDIIDFVELKEIDPVYYDKTYYLAPETSGSKAYQLLQTAMSNTGKIAIARTVLRNNETLACIRVADNHVVVMETLFWPDEVRPTNELPNLQNETAITEQELTMAVTLINQLVGPFQPEKYKDNHREDIMHIIESKLSQNDSHVAPTAQRHPEKIVDLMAALQESIKMTRPEKKATRKKSS